VDAAGMREFEIDPSDFGLFNISASHLLGGDASTNAQILLAILDSTDRGPKRQTVQLNAAAALTVAGLASSLIEAWNLAGDSIDSGRAMNSLEQLRTCTQ
jgi:anthranilate phosphoribosyltransferase